MALKYPSHDPANLKALVVSHRPQSLLVALSVSPGHIPRVRLHRSLKLNPSHQQDVRVSTVSAALIIVTRGSVTVKVLLIMIANPVTVPVAGSAEKASSRVAA